MVYFEVGQDRLAEPHPLKVSEWPQGAIKGAPGPSFDLYLYF